MPGKDDTTVTTTKISTRAQIIIAVLGLIGTLVVAYWQFALKPSSQGNSIDIIYSGHVVDASNQIPILGAKITFYFNGSPRVAYTDSEGSYQFALTINSASSAQIRVDADGFQPYIRNITLSASMNYVEDIRLVHVASSIPLATPSLVESNITTETPTSALISTATMTPSPEPEANVADELVKMIDQYYTCLNSAIPNDGDDSDYESCWNMLSNRPDEFQSHLNENDFISYWKKYKVTYELFYCSKNFQGSIQHFVHTRYYVYKRTDDTAPTGNGSAFYLEYLFAHDDLGWRIKGANNNITDIGSFCESSPRINKLQNP